MALSQDEINQLKIRCLKAAATGFSIGKADYYQSELASELGRDPAGSGSPAGLLDLIGQVEAQRSGAEPRVESEVMSDDRPKKGTPKKAKR